METTTDAITYYSKARREELRALLRKGEIVQCAREHGFSRDALERFLSGADTPRNEAYFHALTGLVRRRQQAAAQADAQASQVLATLSNNQPIAAN